MLVAYRQPGRRRIVHMVDDDGTFLATVTAPDAMEVCRTEVTAASRGVSCAEFTRQRRARRAGPGLPPQA